MTLGEILQEILPTQRGVYTGKEKPNQYITWLRIDMSSALNADDVELLTRATYRVTLFSKGDFEEVLQEIKEKLKAAGYYINSVDGELYETSTGYWQVPLTIQFLKE